MPWPQVAREVGQEIYGRVTIITSNNSLFIYYTQQWLNQARPQIRTLELEH